MRVTRSFLLICLCFGPFILLAQIKAYTLANAHSHNDFEQQHPFYQAYQEEFGSLEADIFLFNKAILVGHDSSQLTPSRNLENLYLQPMAESIKRNGGSIYPDSSRRLQFLIDLKTDGLITLPALLLVLEKYPSIIHNPTIQIVISGSRPADSLFHRYPSYIWFDGRLGQSYPAKALSRIAMLSESFGKFSKWKDPAEPFPAADRQKIQQLVAQAHGLHKTVRLWAVPDHQQGWEEMMKLEVDFLNTDRIADLADFLGKQNNTNHTLPYNRTIRSAGEVVRYGKPELENHALDLALLPASGLVVIEDRYGISTLTIHDKKISNRWSYTDMPAYAKLMSTYSGIKVFSDKGKTWVVWSAAEKDNDKSVLMIAEWADGFKQFSSVSFTKKAPAKNALPNDIVVVKEQGETFLYIVLNGNNELVKLRWSDKNIVWQTQTGVAPFGLAVAANKIYVSNWAGRTATDSSLERAGVPWGLAYTDPRTGATASGSVSVFETRTGKQLTEISTGLHPNAVLASADGRFIYVANGNSDEITVIQTASDKVSETIPVGLLSKTKSLQGSSPNALELNKDNTVLYVANGMDNAVAMVQLGKQAAALGKGKTKLLGLIPTEAYPGGLKLVNNTLVVTNLESNGANVIDEKRKARSIHNQLASVSIIPVPGMARLAQYTAEVATLNLVNRTEQFAPRKNITPVPVPARLGEPSVFKHVVYIIKENKTYDQVYGDIPVGRGDSSLCIFGKRITPNMHALAQQYGWMDNYYASGKSSAEGHQWTDAGMVSDYVEKNVRAWFRSYPHRQEDALVYNKSGFIWNQALDHGKTVRIFGEACETEYDRKLKWKDLYKNYVTGKKPVWHNESTIARIRPIISSTFPDCDNIAFSDQQRADIFMEEWKQAELTNSLPNLMVVSLPNDHSAGTSPDFPTPNAMVADNDLAVGRIIDMITKSKYWDSTVIFITQDDSQSGWDHISAYRTVGLVVSPYSSGKLVTTEYNQTSMLRTIEQILGIPPMNVIDATARLMTDCFQSTKKNLPYQFLPNNIPLDEMNKKLNVLSAREKKMALQSQHEVFNEIDGGKDDTMNRIIWYYAKGDAPYPGSVQAKK
jgi:YVTN family beta-propeller protein